MNLASFLRRGLLLVGLLIASWLSPSGLHGFQKHSIDFSTGQYFPRENGTFEFAFVYPNSGAPRFGIADIVPITAKETVTSLDLDEKQHSKLKKIRNLALESISALVEEKKSTEEIEELYKQHVFEVLTEKQKKEWDWLNNRAVFFSAGLLNFLNREDVSTALGLTEKQLESIKEARPKQAAWLKSQINTLYEDAIKKAIEGTSKTTRKRILDLFEIQDQEKAASIGTPSTLHWFFNESKNKVHFDPKLGFVQTVWNINLNSELVCNHGTSYSYGMSNLTRFHFYYGQNIADENQAQIVQEAFHFFMIAASELDDFNDRDKFGKVPFIEKMEEFFKCLQANQSDELFDRYAFQSIVRNVGLVNALKNKVQFEEKPFKRSEIEKIKKNSEDAAKLLRDGSVRILSDFVRQQIPALTAEQSMKLDRILIRNSEDSKKMIPLELVYLGIVMADADRSDYRSHQSRRAGYRLPDFDLIEAAQAESSNRKIIDSRPSRLPVEKLGDHSMK